MANIEINDLKENVTLSEEEVRHVQGGEFVPKIKLDLVLSDSTTFSFDGKGNDIYTR